MEALREEEGAGVVKATERVWGVSLTLLAEEATRVAAPVV